MHARTVRLVAAVVITVATPLANAQTPAPEYGVKGEATRGSNIMRYVTEGSRIPINRTYGELSAEERASVNLHYENVEVGDEPPFPLEGLRPIHGAVASAQQKLGVAGKLVLVASIDVDGTVSQVKAIGSPSPEMAKAAGSIILLSKFKPALCKGRPCKMDFPFSFNFVVR